MHIQIQIDPHTLKRAQERGAAESEIKEVLKTGIESTAKYGKKCKFKLFDFNHTRHGKHYEQKRIEVFYIVEKETIIVIVQLLKISDEAFSFVSPHLYPLPDGERKCFLEQLNYYQ